LIKDNDIIVCKEYKGIEYIQFRKLLEFGIKHAYTLKGEKINFRSKSKEEKESYSKIYEAIGLDVKTLVKPLQNHTSNIKCIDRVWKNKDLPDIDGLITDKKEIALTTTNADCILLLFYDPVKKVIANIHSGWKGTFQKIGEKAVIKMITNYKCNPEDIYCFISPSIRKCHFEVDEEVKDLCENIFSFTNKTNEFIEIGKVVEGKQKYMIDTVLINRMLLTSIGLKNEKIIDCDICSLCNSDKINSYRAEGKDFRLATAIISL
jgi:YfiH family protein